MRQPFSDEGKRRREASQGGCWAFAAFRMMSPAWHRSWSATATKGEGKGARSFVVESVWGVEASDQKGRSEAVTLAEAGKAGEVGKSFRFADSLPCRPRWMLPVRSCAESLARAWTRRLHPDPRQVWFFRSHRVERCYSMLQLPAALATRRFPYNLTLPRILLAYSRSCARARSMQLPGHSAWDVGSVTP